MKITFGMFLDGTQWSEKDSDFDKWVKQRQEDIADAFGSWVEELRKNPLEKSEQIPHARRLIPPCAEKKKNTEESKTVLKFQWADIMTEVWQWEALGFENQKILAALHNQPQCYIKLTQGKGDYELFMRGTDKKVASKVDKKEVKDIISEALNRFHYDDKEKNQ